MWHDGLSKHRVIKGESDYIVRQKAIMQAAEWDERWSVVSQKTAERQAKEDGKRYQDSRKEDAAAATTTALEEQTALQALLEATLEIDDRVDWEQLKSKAEFPQRRPKQPPTPAAPQEPRLPRRPMPEDSTYQPALGILDRVFAKRKAAKHAEARQLFDLHLENWKQSVDQLQRQHKTALQLHAAAVQNANEAYQKDVAAWTSAREAYLSYQAEQNSVVNAKRDAYKSGDPAAIEDYCDLVLSASSYPDYFPQEYELGFDLSAKTLVVDYQLPSPDELPTLRAVKYVASRDALEESHLTEAQRAKLFDDVMYQVALRTVHEIFEADVIDAVQAVVFNGIVTAVDRTTGNSVTSCILSVRASKEEFQAINLANVDPKACFKALKGVASAKLSGLSPVAPVMRLNKEDSRFVAAYGVTSDLDEGFNLASMPWEDFEHLIREVFEQEFSTSGGEVKVTQASRDGGVDAVAFDPDPIRGGKIVIQAKRYTNTVGVGAVRDLYGTVMAEGANKGVLVTTADYGPDSYAFANGKPLVLLNGSNLLHMLSKHGHKAKIDIREARLSKA
jgi:restriction system protein